METNTLRIGNKIQDEHGFILDVVGIGKDWITVDFEGNEGDVWEFDFKHSFPQPIELTEEILLKCGFERDNGVMCYTVDDFSDVKIVYETLANYYRLYPYTYKIKYLHDLQNIFYSITGEELNIKL